MFFYSERTGDTAPHMRVAPNGAAGPGQDSDRHQEAGDRDRDAHQAQAQVSRDDQIGYNY